MDRSRSARSVSSTSSGGGYSYQRQRPYQYPRPSHYHHQQAARRTSQRPPPPPVHNSSYMTSSMSTRSGGYTHHVHGHRSALPVWDTRGHNTSLGSGTRSTISSASKDARRDVMLMDIDLTPNYKRKTSCNTWAAVAVQFIEALLAFVVFWSPGWGRSRESNTQDDTHLNLHGDYGLWFVCYHPELDSKAVTCKATLAFPAPSKQPACHIRALRSLLARRRLSSALCQTPFHVSVMNEAGYKWYYKSLILCTEVLPFNGTR